MPLNDDERASYAEARASHIRPCQAGRIHQNNGIRTYECDLSSSQHRCGNRQEPRWPSRISVGDFIPGDRQEKNHAADRQHLEGKGHAPKQNRNKREDVEQLRHGRSLRTEG